LIAAEKPRAGSGMNANRMAIVPGATHYNIGADPRLAATALGFLE
jgi:hypothetical protein